MPGGAVLITGCSSGVGAATVRRLLAAGRPVYATARDVGALESLAAAGAVPLHLDLTDEASMVAAVEKVQAGHGTVAALVNNAGYGLAGAVEAVSVEHVRQEFETALFGVLRLVQLVVPTMRAAGAGRIVTVSPAGRLSVPGSGWTAAANQGVEAMSDALRSELRPFGVTVSVVQPGPIGTAYGEKFNGTLPPPTGTGPYDMFHADVFASVVARYERASVLAADDVAAVVARAVTARRVRGRYRVGTAPRTVRLLSRLLPDAAIDSIVRSRYPVPQPGE